MSGVQVGTRLEQLQGLLHQIDHQIAQERHRLWLVTPSPRTRLRQLGRKTESAANALLEERGVTARDVKEWAVAAGLNTKVPRGRVSLQLVQTYAEAHGPDRI